MDNHQAALDHFQQGRLSEAIAACRQILTAPPANPSELSQLAKAAHRSGRPDVAAQLLSQIVWLQPRSPAAHLDLANALMAIGRTEQAIAAYQLAISLQPTLAEAHCNLGVALGLQNKFQDSIASLQKATDLRPDFPEAHDGLGIVLRAGGDAEAAVESHNRAIQLRPGFASAHANLALALADLGLIHQALAEFRRALEISPSLRVARSAYISAMHFQPGINPRKIFQQHLNWGELHAPPQLQQSRPYPNTPDPSRPLRVGYVSSDFRAHAVSFFMEPLLAGHNPANVQVFCYADLVKRDAVSHRLQSFVPNWRDVTGRANPDVARIIRDDRIDILVDLTGHTGGERLLLFAEKPAPIQATYLGYIDTTGVRAIDYRISDPFADPPGETDQYHSEKLLRLPQTFACYSPSAESPPVAPLPALQNGYVTFGSFNTIQKLSRPLVESWADLLAQVPNSRLLAVARAFKYPNVRQRILSVFLYRGLEPQRVTLLDELTFPDYLAAHHRVDILLDSFPVNGHTVTCHALWMGVPVVTYCGQTYCQRLGNSVLTNLGLPDLVAQTPAGYVEIAAGLAADVPRLGQLRATLRDRMKSSPLTSAPSFARDVEGAYRDIWRSWCSA
jgi:protein O-GlcNAc transferase